MSKLNAILEAQQTEFTNPADLLAEIEAKERKNGLCPFMAECYKALGLVNRHCSWNLDNPRTWQFCGGYKRRKKGMG